ncbi:MAG: hypothetical protein ACREAK_03355 [Nitrosarchaeum sp.]
MSKKPILLLTDKILPEENFKNFEKIIAFDFATHKLLVEKQIPHEISDAFLTSNELETIQNESYNFIKWYNNESVSEFLKYRKINLGKLFFVEFQYLIVPFLKLFVEILKIFQKYPNADFVTTPKVHSIISTLTKSVTIFNTEFKNSSKQQVIKYGFKIGKKHFTIGLSQKNFEIIKNFSEIFIYALISKNPDPSKKNILMIDFSTLRYKNFFLNLAKSKLNVILHNRNTPYVWNYESFSILKKSNCSLTTNHVLFDKTVKNSFEKATIDLSSRLNFLWQCDDFFATFFSIYDVSFWPSLKKTFIPLFEKRLIEYIKEIEMTKKLFENYSFSSILVWSESGVNEQIAIAFAKQNNIKISLIQHGLYNDTVEADDFNKLGIMPCHSDKFLVWGQILKNYAINCGIPAEKIEIVGSPIYDDFFLKTKDSDFNDSFILLATTSPSINAISDLTFAYYSQREQIIQKICQTVSKLNKKMIIKLHPSPDEIDITDFVHKLNAEIIVVKAGNILDLMKNCEVFITLDVSTSILESQICKNPTISVFVVDRGFGNAEVFKSKSCIQVNVDEVEDVLLKLLNDDAFKKKIIEAGKKFSDKYLNYQGNSSQHLLTFLENF